MNQFWSPRSVYADPDQARVTAMVARGDDIVVLDLETGDRLSIIDPEGGQRAELFFEAGAVAPDATQTVRGFIHPDEAGVQAALRSRGLTADTLMGLSLFQPDAPAGSRYDAVATRPSVCLVRAPGRPMAPDAQNPPTDIVVEITGAKHASGKVPPAIAPCVLDIRIEAATARAYTVKAGDYIQIIDVDGRQCSDFLAFDAAALGDSGEYGLDPTTTRTLMGSTAPTPGLHGKYFDQRMVPLVEIIQDTVGRHDTFMLACSAKYYEDMGYPGHSNCTDNFNTALEPFGVKPRKGWPAINFFYNTAAGPDDQISMDEPWSRPGDYVLLRALTDLVCASSSCADDIDPANAWCPTDIHVRVYDAETPFSNGLSHRMTPDSEPRLTRQTGFHARTSALTQTMVDYRGFWLPTCFSQAGAIAEYWACRERAVVMDLSALRKFEVIGPDAEDLMQLAMTRNVKKLAVGQVVYTAMCNAQGGMIDDGTVFRLGPHNFRWICGDDYSGLWLRDLAKQYSLKVWVKSSTDQLHNVAVQGPRSRAILSGLVVTPPHQPTLDALKWFRFTIGKIGAVPVIVSRTGYTGELGYEVWCHPSQAPLVWDAVWAKGRPDGLMPMGLTALDMLRIEAGLVFAGYDFCDQTDPFEAGIGFTVAKDKTDFYIGSEAIARRRDNPHRQLVGLDITGNETIGHGDPVFSGRTTVGTVTSAAKSPILGKTIALARLDVSVTALGQILEIGKLDGHQKRLAATVVSFPHFDPKKTRVRAEAMPDPL